jgi:hypothetical protein
MAVPEAESSMKATWQRPAPKEELSMSATDVSPDAGVLASAALPGHVPGARIFVWAIWGFLASAAFSFVARNGSSVPYWDEWSLVPAVTGQQPLTLEFLWAQHNEHRIPLPKLVLMGLTRLCRADFRAGLLANVAAQSAMAAALILAATRSRGCTIYADAFFPLALLHLGHHANFESSFQVAFILSEVLACTFLLLIASTRRLSTVAGVVAAGMCLVALPYVGAHGAGLVPALMLWMVVSAAAS